MLRTRLPDEHCTIYAIVDLIRNRKVDLRPPYQRQLVWTDKDRQLLLDSIVKNYDIGKLYLHEVLGKPHGWEVIDGQQRLYTLTLWLNGSLEFPPESGEQLAGRTLPSLSNDQQIKFGSYHLDIIVVKDASDTEVREMFRRLQLGKRLTTGERLKAYYGKLHDYIESQTLNHAMFSAPLLGFGNKRDVHFEVATQMVCLSLRGQACAVEYKDLEDLLTTHKVVVPENDWRAVCSDLDAFARVLQANGGTFHPDKANAVSLFLFISRLRRDYAPIPPAAVCQFIKELEKSRRALPLTDSDLLEYNKKLSGGTGKRRSIQFRLDMLMEKFLTRYPDTALRDDRRVLTREQKLAVYYRDHRKCTRCGLELSDRDFEVHHVDAWFRGGPTTVTNSVTVCRPCHQELTRQSG